MRIDNNFLANNFIVQDTKTKPTNPLSSFSDLLGSISNSENSVEQMKTEYLNGERDDIDNILIESEKVNLQLDFALEVRNNLVDMIKQITNMQI